MQITKQIKARKSFEAKVKQASKCRESKRIVSCFSCSQYNTCIIQKKLEEVRHVMS